MKKLKTCLLVGISIFVLIFLSYCSIGSDTYDYDFAVQNLINGVSNISNSITQ